MDPFKGQYESAQHNAMDAVLWKAVEQFYREGQVPMPRKPDTALTAFLRAHPNATFSASLASAMEALGLELTTKTT